MGCVGLLDRSTVTEVGLGNEFGRPFWALAIFGLLFSSASGGGGFSSSIDGYAMLDRESVIEETESLLSSFDGGFVK